MPTRGRKKVSWALTMAKLTANVASTRILKLKNARHAAAAHPGLFLVFEERGRSALCGRAGHPVFQAWHHEARGGAH
jgi:hypothetical protein